MQKLKRPVSIILSILMVVSMFVAVPVTASAATDVAQIGDNKYDTLEAAFAAAVDGDTITLLADCAGNGIKAPQGKFGTNGLTVDFGGFTYTVDGTLVGSSGTETQAFQLLKGNTITFKNGTIYSEKALILVQNYSNLTLDNMTLTLNNPNYTEGYTLSNNNGNTTIKDTTINANPAGGFAFDVCRFSRYPSVHVTVTGNSVINGDVEVSASNGDAKEGFSLTLESGEMYGTVVVDASAQTAMDATPEKATFTTDDSNFKFYVAQIGNTKYEDLQTALNEATAGDEIDILEDIALTGAHWFNVYNDVTIDLNGKTISSEDSVFVTKNGADLTVKNGTMTSSVADDYAIYVNDGSVFTLENGATLTATNSRGNGIIVRTGGQADINGTIETGYYSIAGFGTSVVNVNDGASITSTDASAISGNGSGGNEGYTFNVKGGTLTSTNDVAIYHPNQGTLNITGGTITGKTAVYVKSGSTSISGSSTSISGATISGTGEATAMAHSGNGCNATGDAIVIENCGYPGGTPAIAISGGTITSDNAQPVASYGYSDGTNDYEAITEFISGGTYNKAVPAELCAPAYAPVDNGDSTYGVAKAYVAKIGTTKYATFAQAVAARENNNDVITLLDKVTDAYTMAAVTEAPIKVEKNGKSVTIKAPANVPKVVTSATADGVTTYDLTDATFEITKANGIVTYSNSLDLLQPNGATVKLLKDFTSTSCPNVSSSVYKTGTVTLDLGGKTLYINTTTNRNYCLLVGQSRTLNITNGTLSMTPTAAKKENGIIIQDNGTLNLADDVTVIANGVSAVSVFDGTTLNTAADITANGDFAIATNGTQTGNTINITGGAITSDITAIYFPSGGNLNISGGTITGKTAVYVKSGNVAISGGSLTGNGAAADYTYNGNGANATGDAIVVDSCGYPNGAPKVTISGNPTITSTNGKQIGDYSYGDNTLGEVTATSNTMTLPEGLSWVETDTPGVYTVGHVHAYTLNPTFNWTQDAQTGDWNCNKLTLTCSCGDTQVNDVTGFFGASAVTCTADANGDFTYSVSKKIDGVTYSDTKTLDANGVIKSVTQLKAAAKKGGNWELDNDLTGVTDVQCANGFVLDGNNHTVTRHANVSTQAVFRTTTNPAEITLENLTIDGIANQSDSKPAIATKMSNPSNGNVINLENVSIVNYDFDAANNGTILAWGQATVNMTDCTVANDSTYDVWAGAAAKVNINGGEYGNVYLNSGSTSGAALDVDDDADVDTITLGGANAKATINEGTVDEIASTAAIQKEAVVIDPNNATVTTIPAGYTWVDSATTGMKTLGKSNKLFVGHNLTLGGNIGVNFFIDSTAANFANATSATVKFTWDNNEYSEEVNLKTMTPVAGIYKASVEVVAAHMAHKIHAVVYIDGVALAETDDYSVQDYAEEVYYDNNKPEKLRALAKAMLNYGAEAQTVFADALKEHPNRADKNVGQTDYSNVTAALVKSKIIGTSSNLNDVAAQVNANYYTNSLIYLQNNTLRIYFTPQTYPANMPNASAYDGNLSSYYYYKDVKGIAAAKLDEQQEFTINDVNFTYTALDYVVSVLNSGMTGTQKNLAKALFLYNQAANAYFG